MKRRKISSQAEEWLLVKVGMPCHELAIVVSRVLEVVGSKVWVWLGQHRKWK